MQNDKKKKEGCWDHIQLHQRWPRLRVIYIIYSSVAVQ